MLVKVLVKISWLFGEIIGENYFLSVKINALTFTADIDRSSPPISMENNDESSKYSQKAELREKS
jgi:hypothetical protein